MSPEDWDDPLDDEHVHLEARFRELEQEAEIEQLRATMGRDPGDPPAARGADTSAPRSQKSAAAAQDPLAHMKSAFDEETTSEDSPDEQATDEESRDGAVPSVGALIVICPGCKAKNRVSLARVRRFTPICGQCKQELVVRA